MSAAQRARRAGLVAALVALVVALLAVAGRSWCGVPATQAELYLRWCYSDIPLLFGVERLDVGAVPYLDHPVEYPPLTGLWMWLAALPVDTAGGFLATTAVLLVVSAAVTGWVLGREVGLRRALVFAAAPTLLVSGAINWDLPTIALAAGGLVAHRRGNDGWSALLLGLGAAAKAWPALLVPGVALAAWRLRGPRAGLVVLLGSAGTWAVVNVPVALLAPEGWGRFFTLSRERPADWNSLWRIVPLRTGLDVPAGDGLNTAVAVVTLLGFAALLVVALRRHRPEAWHLLGLPVVAWFLLAGKVWSPQFTLWLLPLLALAAPTPAGLVALGVTDVAVNVTVFPYLANFVGLEGWPALPFELAVVARALVVAWLGWSAWQRAARRPELLGAHPRALAGPGVHDPRRGRAPDPRSGRAPDPDQETSSDVRLLP